MCLEVGDGFQLGLQLDRRPEQQQHVTFLYHLSCVLILDFLTAGWLGSKNRREQGRSVWCFMKAPLPLSSVSREDLVVEVLPRSEGRDIVPCLPFDGGEVKGVL